MTHFFYAILFRNFYVCFFLPMELITELKEQLGISQQEIADYLGISRSAVSMAESYHRELSTKAMLKLLKLRQLLSEAGKALSAVKNQQNVPSKDFLQKHHQECLKKQQQLREKLALILAANTRSEKVLQTTALLLNDLPKGIEGKKDKVWLELLISRHQEILAQNNPETISLLQLQIKTLGYEARVVLGMINKL